MAIWPPAPAFLLSQCEMDICRHIQCQVGVLCPVPGKGWAMFIWLFIWCKTNKHLGVFDRTFPGQHLINQQQQFSLLDVEGNPSISRHHHQLCPAEEGVRESDSCTAAARGDSNTLATATRESSSQLLLSTKVLPCRPGESLWERQVVVAASETAGTKKTAASPMANSSAGWAMRTSKVWLLFSKGSCSPN